MKKSILVIGSSNGSYNLGDSSMWEAAVQLILSHSPESKLFTDGPAGWVSPFPKVTVLPLLHEEFKRWRGSPRSRATAAARLLVNAGSVRRGIKLADDFVGGKVSSPVLDTWYKTIEAVDGVVFSGAGGITDDYALHGVAGWSAIARRAASRGKPVAFIGQGIGPIRSVHVRREASRMFKSASLVTTRDPASQELLNELGYSGAGGATADWAIALQVSHGDREEAERLGKVLCGDRNFVAVSFHDRQGASRKDLAMLANWLQAITSLAADRGLAVVCIPNCTFYRRSDDRVFMGKLIDDLPIELSKDVSLLQERVTPAVARALLGRAHSLISTRYHPVVFALAEGTVSGGLSFDAYYDQKLKGAMCWYNEEERVHRVSEGPAENKKFISDLLTAGDRNVRNVESADVKFAITDPLKKWLKDSDLGEHR